MRSCIDLTLAFRPGGAQISREPSPKLTDPSAWSAAMNEFVTQARAAVFAGVMFTIYAFARSRGVTDPPVLRWVACAPTRPQSLQKNARQRPSAAELLTQKFADGSSKARAPISVACKALLCALARMC